jgi:hypothetical protein
VRATDPLARQEYQIYERTNLRLTSLNQGLSRIYVPMIVTTAEMYICDADYDGIDLETGEVTDLTKSSRVPVVRFMKAFDAGDAKQSGAVSIEKFADQSERTVVVVQARAFIDPPPRPSQPTASPATLDLRQYVRNRRRLRLATAIPVHLARSFDVRVAQTGTGNSDGLTDLAVAQGDVSSANAGPCARQVPFNEYR